MKEKALLSIIGIKNKGIYRAKLIDKCKRMINKATL